MEERRQNSIDSILMLLGELKQLGENQTQIISALDQKVKIQNGRVKSLEMRNSFIAGAISLIVIVVIPIAIRVFSSWMANG